MTQTTGELQSITVHGPATGRDVTVDVPGDKSISHRAVMLGAVAEGTTRISGFLPANDCLATIEAMRALGVDIEYGGDRVVVHGRGSAGLMESIRPVECGGSGTTMRLLAGLLAGQPIYSVLAGNAQLSKRPMDRVSNPLRQMGATILGRDDGRLPPLTIRGGGLRGTDYTLPVASAQVKSAVLLAGLYAEGETVVHERVGTRDHTERMLGAMGADIEAKEGCVAVRRSPLRAIDVRVPGDISSAAFMLGAGAMVPGTGVLVRAVGINPGRVGILRALTSMGVDLAASNVRVVNGEPVAELTLSGTRLRGIVVGAEEVPGMIDELPLLAVLATQAEGRTEVRGAAELRVKETDRIATIVAELSKMGAHIKALPEGFVVEGPTKLKGAVLSSHGDHRMAMSLCVAALVAEGVTKVEDTACTDDSFPGFGAALAKFAADVEVTWG